MRMESTLTRARDMTRRIHRAAGYVAISVPGERTVEGETRQCAHCGMHWLYVPGSGARRGFCMKCRGLTCGKTSCDPCVPHEARVELMEGAPSGAPARRYMGILGEVEG